MGRRNNSIFLEDIDPILPNFQFMFSWRYWHRIQYQISISCFLEDIDPVFNISNSCFLEDIDPIFKIFQIFNGFSGFFDKVAKSIARALGLLPYLPLVVVGPVVWQLTQLAACSMARVGDISCHRPGSWWTPACRHSGSGPHRGPEIGCRGPQANAQR